MKQRLNFFQQFPESMGTFIDTEKYLQKNSSGLEKSLLELVKVRASQINHCAYCIDMHSKDARAIGESNSRLDCLSVWREVSFYTPQERAALAWTEALTLISQGDISDEVYQHAQAHFSEHQLLELSINITAINAWNRIAVAFKPQAGHYQPGNFEL